MSKLFLIESFTMLSSRLNHVDISDVHDETIATIYGLLVLVAKSDDDDEREEHEVVFEISVQFRVLIRDSCVCI